jgi:TPR repeat protein
MIRLIRLLGTFVLALSAAVGAPADGCKAETRVALVIGNGAYHNAPRLPNPVNDATGVAAALKRAGFETMLSTDLDKAGMDEATIRFARAARTADVAMFYYSGHALQFGGVNYLAPVDIKLTDEADLRRMTRVDEIVGDLAQARNLRILVLDSCRDNPLADQLKRSIGASRALPLQQGLAKIDSPEGMIIAYATQAGRTADDGDGKNSPYTAAFLRHIDEKEEIGSIFRRISADVYETTKHAQLPELSLSLIGEFYLNGRLEISAPPKPDLCVAAADHWKSAETIATLAVFEDHLARFPTCAFAGLAKARIESLKSKAASIVPPSAPALRRDLITDCDRQASLPLDSMRPPGVAGVYPSALDIPAAQAACDDAMRQYPEVARFVFQAGRVAVAQKDYARANQLFEKAVSMGSKYAMVALGDDYQFAAKDYTMALQWFEKAVAAGEPHGMKRLGDLYSSGRGVTQDYTQARQWYEKAASAGDSDAMAAVGKMYEKGSGIAMDYSEARKRYEQSATAGSPIGMMYLGDLYADGKGVFRDFAKAREWYEKAVAIGYLNAKVSLKRLEAAEQGKEVK